MEEKHDQGTGDRYLVELELVEISSGKSVRFSEYVYRPWGTSDLCSPVGISWNKSAVINIILATGNKQGRWLLHFLHHMSKIHNKTKDFNLNVVITEFDGVDIDLKAALKRSAIPSYQYVRLPEKFQKAYGLQLAAGMVKDPNSILFVMDLHLDIPYHFFDDVRKVSNHSKKIPGDNSGLGELFEGFSLSPRLEAELISVCLLHASNVTTRGERSVVMNAV